MSRVGNTVGSNKSRKDMRAVVTLVARYRSPTTFEYANEACFDISVGGMFIKSAAPAPAGTLLKLECETDNDNDVKIRGVARVVWLRRETNEHGPSGMGVKFVKLEAGSRELIESIVQRLADAGVQARSVSAAPETQLAGTEAQRGSTGKVQLVPSNPPAGAANEQAAAPRQEGPSVGQPAAPPPEPVAARAEPIVAAPAAEPEPASRRSEPPPPEAEPIAARTPVAEEPPAESEPTTETRPSSRPTGSSRPTAPKPSRFGVKHWVIAIAVVLIAVAIADRRGFGGSDQAEVTPEPEGTGAPAAPPPPAAAPAAAPAPAPAPAGELPPNAPRATPEPAAAAEPPAAAARRTAEPAAAPAGPAVATAADAPGAPLYPVKPGAKDYLIEFVSRPNAAEVTVDDKATLTTPFDLHIGAMPERIKITAKKPGFKSSSIWLPREGFELKDGLMRKRVYLTLKPEAQAAPP